MRSSTPRSKACLLTVGIVCTASVAQAGSLPPIRSPGDAMAQLSLKAAGQQVAALGNLASACRGRMRHALRDHPAVLRRLSSLARSPSTKVKRAVMDCARCFTPAKFVTLLSVELADSDPAVVSYVAEVVARVADPAVVPPLLAELEKHGEACRKPGLAAERVEVCVWLTYAPGAALQGAAAELRGEAATLASAQLASPYPKVREVAVETVAASRLARFAPAVAELIARETKKGGFDAPNDPALIGRFKKRLRALKKGD